jgi:capsid protein
MAWYNPRSWFTARPSPQASALNRQTERLLSLLGRYDNAQTTPENARLWGLADPLSAKSANSFQVRRTLRNRSRYEYGNNSYLQGSVNTKVNDLIGTGPTLKVTTPDEAFNRKVEAAFASWAKAVAFTEKLRTAAKAKIVDGEGFLFLTTYRDLNHSVKLFPLDVECDQVTSQMPSLDQAHWVDGLVLDELGQPRAYTLLQSHPGDFCFQNNNPLAYKQVLKRWVIHWFRKDRPGQVRGIPETTSTLDLWGEMRRFRKATVTAAETAAAIASVLETEMPAEPDEDELDAQGMTVPFKEVVLERGTTTITPWGAKLKQLKAEHPTTTFDMFREATLGESSRGIGVPLNIVLGTSQKFNFSSAKLDHMGYYASLRIERSDCEEVALEPTLHAFLDEGVMVPGLLPDGIDIENLPHEWHWPAFLQLDPQADAQADTERLTVNKTKTYREFFAEQGQDWQEQFGQLAKEAAELERLGIAPAEAAAAATGSKKDPAANGTGGTPTDAAADVQATALNGAQVVSLVAVCDKLVAKQYTPKATEAILRGAFPGIPAELVSQIVSELTNHEPPAAEPAPDPETEPNGAPTEKEPVTAA